MIKVPSKLSPPHSSREPRRRPRQQRAIVTVSNILQATEQLARRRGFIGLETAKVAATAGISIGSLYQYFPNLEAIALALYEERSREVALSMKAAMVAALDEPPAVALPGVMELILQLHEKHQLILHRMVDELPQLKLAQHPISLDRLVRGSVAHYLRHQDASLSVDEINRRTFFVEKTVLGCIRSYLQDASDISREDFTHDLAMICVRYLGVVVSKLPPAQARF